MCWLGDPQIKSIAGNVSVPQIVYVVVRMLVVVKVKEYVRAKIKRGRGKEPSVTRCSFTVHLAEH